MGFGGISPWQLLILLAIVLAIFGTKKLRNIGGDLGGAMRDFKGAMRENEDEKDSGDDKSDDDDDDERIVDHQDSTQTRNASDAKTGETQAKETAGESSQKNH